MCKFTCLLFDTHKKHEDKDIQAQGSQQVCHEGIKSDLSEVQMSTIWPFCFISISETSTVFMKHPWYPCILSVCLRWLDRHKGRVSYPERINA